MKTDLINDASSTVGSLYSRKLCSQLICPLCNVLLVSILKIHFYFVALEGSYYDYMIRRNLIPICFPPCRLSGNITRFLQSRKTPWVAIAQKHGDPQKRRLKGKIMILNLLILPCFIGQLARLDQQTRLTSK